MVADMEACVALWVEALTARDGVEPPLGTAESCRSRFELPLVSWRVLRGTSGQMLGFGLIASPGTGVPTDPPTAAHLALLAVHPAIRGRGLGVKLLATLVEDAGSAGYDAAVLHVRTDNQAATRLYESTGWRAEGPLFLHPLSGKPTQTYVLSPLKLAVRSGDALKSVG